MYVYRVYACGVMFNTEYRMPNARVNVLCVRMSVNVRNLHGCIFALSFSLFCTFSLAQVLDTHRSTQNSCRFSMPPTYVFKWSHCLNLSSSKTLKHARLFCARFIKAIEKIALLKISAALRTKLTPKKKRKTLGQGVLQFNS